MATRFVCKSIKSGTKTVAVDARMQGTKMKAMDGRARRRSRSREGAIDRKEREIVPHLCPKSHDHKFLKRKVTCR